MNSKSLIKSVFLFNFTVINLRMLFIKSLLSSKQDKSWEIESAQSIFSLI